VIVVGLTGGIGSGKSALSEMLARRGAVVIDADQVAREVVEPGAPAYPDVVARFGTGVLSADGRLDRAALAAIVFDDEGARASLNRIVHPAVRKAIVARLAELQAASAAGDGAAPVVVVEVPLLVETGAASRYPFSGILVVDATEDVALQRLARQRAMSEAEARARIGAQASREERVRVADFVILNMGDLAELELMADQAYSWARSLVAAGSPAGADGSGC
jgi:dephospho-CoA kinase